MPWPFGKSNAGSRPAVVAFIRHCQSLIATQQLTMEIYNEAMELASEDYEGGDELLVRGGGMVNSPDMAEMFLLPAVDEKIGLLVEISERHQSIADGLLVPSGCESAHKLLGEAIVVWLARAVLQKSCWQGWIDDPGSNFGAQIGALDGDEFRKTGIALQEINTLVAKYHISQPEFLEINRAAFNYIRLSRGLNSLDPNEFRARYTAGIDGRRARFFIE